MIQLKKVINKYKFERIRDNKRTYTCRTYLHDRDHKIVSQTGFLLGDHLYMYKAVGVFPHTRFEYYDYYIGEIGDVHYRANKLAFYKLRLTNEI